MQEIYVDDVGTGFPLVLVHGYLGSSEMWTFQKDYLSKYFSIAIPEPKIIKEAKNNLGSISLGYFTITPIGIEKIPSNCNDFAI